MYLIICTHSEKTRIVCVCRKLPSIWRHWINRMSTENRYIKAGFDAESWDHCVWFVHASLVGELTKSHNFRISHRYYNIFFFLNIPRNEKKQLTHKHFTETRLSYNARTCQHFNTSVAHHRQTHPFAICMLFVVVYV